MGTAAAIAEQIRRHRSDLVKAIRDGRVPMSELLDDTDPLTNQVKIVVLAEAVPEVGKVRARRVLSALGIADGTRWGELTSAQARRLIGVLAESAAADRPRSDGA